MLMLCLGDRSPGWGGWGRVLRYVSYIGTCHPKGCVVCTVFGLKLSPHITPFCLKFGIKFGEESSPKNII